MNLHSKLIKRLPTPFILKLATLGPIGYIRYAPGTWGSFAGLLLYIISFQRIESALFFIMEGFFIYISILICEEAEIRLQKKDPSEVVLDEFVAVPLCYIGLTEKIQPGISSLLILSIGFILFRLFDILKPFPITKLQNLPGGTGIVIDDIAAALASCALLHIGMLFF